MRFGLNLYLWIASTDSVHVFSNPDIIDQQCVYARMARTMLVRSATRWICASLATALDDLCYIMQQQKAKWKINLTVSWLRSFTGNGVQLPPVHTHLFLYFDFEPWRPRKGWRRRSLFRRNFAFRPWLLGRGWTTQSLLIFLGQSCHALFRKKLWC